MLAKEYRRLLIICLVGGSVGLVLFNQLALGLFLGLFIFVIHHVRNIHSLQKWLIDSKTSAPPPEGTGIWFDIFNRIYALQKRNKSQKVKLAAALNRFQSAASAMPDGMLILTHDGKIEWFNEATKRLLGLKTPNDIAQPVTNLIRYPDFKAFVDSSSFEDEGIEIFSPVDESVTIQIRLVPYGKGKRLMVAQDVTKLNQLEQVRRNFVANISHELRTPLTVLTGYMETLLDDDRSQDNKWHDPVEKMHLQTNRMQGIVKDLLLLTRLENFSGATVNDSIIDVPKLVEQLADEAKMLGMDKQQLITSDCDASLKLQGKQEDIRSAFSNLVSNAVRYTREGGTIHLTWCADEHGVYFKVTDSGMGIAQKDIPHLTERFFRVDEARSRETGGTGLGLAIVKHVLLCHDGEISISSEIGKGSVFTCHFPMARIVRLSSATVE